jgi:hypothetical protein
MAGQGRPSMLMLIPGPSVAPIVASERGEAAPLSITVLRESNIV